MQPAINSEPIELPGRPHAARRRFVSNVATVLGGQAGTVALALLTEVCAARLVGPAARGQISLCVMSISFLSLIGGLGADIPIVIWTADRSRKVSDWLSAVLLWGMLGLAVAEVLWWLAFSKWQITPLHGVTPGLAKIILLTIPFVVLYSFLNALLTGSERFREQVGVSLLRSAACLTGFLMLALMAGRNAEAYLWGNLLGMAVAGAAAALILREMIAGSLRVPEPSEELFRGLGIGLRGQIGNVAAFFNYRLDVFIVNYFLDPAHVGLYAIGVAVSEALWQVPQAVAMTLFPRTARTINEGASSFTCRITRQVFLISGVSAVGIAVVGTWAVPLVFGKQFSPSVPVIWWLLPGTVAMSVAKVAAADLAARAKTGYSSAFGLIAFAVTVVLDLLLIPRMGIEGAAVASSIAYSINGTLLMIALKHILKVGWAELVVPSRAELQSYKRVWDVVAGRMKKAE